MDERSDVGCDSYVTTHNIHQTEIYVPSDSFEPAIPAFKCPHTHALDQLEMETQNADTILKSLRDVTFLCTVHVYVRYRVMHCTESSMCCNWVYV